jgi:hypothetical protein
MQEEEGIARSGELLSRGVLQTLVTTGTYRKQTANES